MFLFSAPAKPQPCLNTDQYELPAVADHPPGYTPRIPWLIALIAFVQHCIQRAITQSIAYVAFPFILDDLSDEAPAMGGTDNSNESDWVQRPKAHPPGSDLITILLLIIRLLKEQREVHKQQQERKLVEKVVLQYLHVWKLSLSKSRNHHFRACHAHCLEYFTIYRARSSKTYENICQLVPPPAFFGGTRCQSYCNCPKFCEYNWPLQSTPCKPGVPIS